MALIITSLSDVFNGLSETKIYSSLNEAQCDIKQLHSLLKETLNQNRYLLVQLKQAKDAEERIKATVFSDKDKLTRLEKQISMLKQDYSSESSQRERMQAKNKELQLELAVIQRQLGQYQQIQMDNIYRNRVESMNHYQMQYQQNKVPQDPRFRAQTSVDKYEEGYDTVDLGPLTSYPPAPASATSPLGQCSWTDSNPRMNRTVSSTSNQLNRTMSSASSSASSSVLQRLGSDGDSVMSDDHAEEEDTFQCPSCDREFLVSDCEAFIAHTDACG